MIITPNRADLCTKVEINDNLNLGTFTIDIGFVKILFEKYLIKGIRKRIKHSLSNELILWTIMLTFT